MEEELLNQVGQFLVQELQNTFSQVYPSRGFGGRLKPTEAQFPPIYASKSGRYSQSLSYRINTDAESNQPFIEIFSTLPDDQNYGRFLESGRAPGSFPNITAIEAWIRKKSIRPLPLPQKEKNGNVKYRIPTLKQLTYLLSRSIFREGVFPFPFSDITIQRVEAQLAQQLEPAMRERLTRIINEQVVFIINPNRQTR